METTNSNKLALALLGTLLATMALGIFSNAIFAPHKAIKPGYDLPGAQENLAALQNRFPSIGIVPVSAMKGEGIEELKTTLAKWLGDAHEQDRQSQDRHLESTKPIA